MRAGTRGTMNRMIVATMAVGWLAAVALGDVPTTQPVAMAPPTTRPARAKQAAPKDWVKIENVKNHFDYFVPRTWKQTSKSDDQAEFQFGDPRQMQEGQLIVAALTGCHQTNVNDFAAWTRDNEPKLQPDHKWVHDEMQEMGGRPSWMYVMESSAQGVMIRNGVRSTFEVKQRSAIWTTIQGSQYYQFILFTDGKSYAKNLVFVQRVVDSLAWTDLSATTKPGT